MKTALHVSSTPELNEDILQSLSEQVWIRCSNLRQLLNWHSVNKYLWDEFQKIEDTILLARLEKKKQENRELLKKTLFSHYRVNMIGAIHSIADGKVDTPFSSIMIYNIEGWHNWKGIRFDNEKILSETSKDLIKAVVIRLCIRYGWTMIFRFENASETTIELGYPFNDAIKHGFHCFLREVRKYDAPLVQYQLPCTRFSAQS